MRGVLVGEEVGDNGRLEDELAVEVQRGHKTARVDGEVLGRARRVEVDDDLLEGHLELGQGNVHTVCPCVCGGRKKDVRALGQTTASIGSTGLTWADVVGVEN